MTSTEHHDRTATEARLVAALAAGADAVTAAAPAGSPRPERAGVAPVRLLRTRRGVAALAVTAVVAGAAGAAAAAIPGEDTPAPERAGSTAAPADDRSASRGPEQVDVDGDGEVDPVRVVGSSIRVRLSASGTTDRARFVGQGRLLTLEPTLDDSDGGDVLAVVVGGRPGGAPNRIGFYVLDERGFVDPAEVTDDQRLVRLDRLSRWTRVRVN